MKPYFFIIALLSLTFLTFKTIRPYEYISPESRTDYQFLDKASESLLHRGAISTKTPTTITHAGVYCLNSPLIASNGNTALTIQANNVTLDLAGNTISGGTTGIHITGDEVTVKNGTISGTCMGIYVTGARCHIENIDVISSHTGFLFQNTHDLDIHACRALNSTCAGFSLVSSYTNTITACQALHTDGGTYSAYGFISQNGSGNLFTDCLAQDTQTGATNASYCAAGFLLSGEKVSTLRSCTALASYSRASTTAAYGIYLQNTQHCVCTDNIANKNTTSNALGIGIRAQSTTNYIAENVSSANDTNFQDIASSYRTSPANTRGVYNTDTNLSDPDTIVTINATVNAIFTQDQTITSKLDTVASSIDSFSRTINSQIDTINTDIASVSHVCVTANSKLDVATIATSKIDSEVTACWTTGIPAYASTTTLSSEGSYCLQAYHAGPISINASNVTLDLNGYHTETVYINRNLSNLVIKNGTANAIATYSGTGTIYNVQISNVLCNAPSKFYYITGLYLKKCSFYTSSGITIEAAAVIDHCNAAELFNCTARGNNTDNSLGFYLNACNKIFVRNCYASELDTGFAITSCKTGDFLRCISQSNRQYGFYVNQPNLINFISCIAKNNSGDAGSAGFIFTGDASSVAIVRGCSTEGSSTGTLISGVEKGLIFFANNFSRGNYANWSGTIHGAGISSLTTNPSYWTNTNA
jgi:hypothetical protein